MVIFFQNQAISLFTAVAKGDMAKVEQLNNAYYQDKVRLKGTQCKHNTLKL